MSVGHSHKPKTTADHRAELARIWQTPWFQRGLKLPKRLIRSSQIPWLGGSSTDLKNIYIDPRFQGEADYLKVTVDVAIFVPAVIEHEGVEGICLVLGRDAAGQKYTYDGAHELATCAEEIIAARICKRHNLRFDRTAYEAIYKPFLKETVQGPWLNLPADLNLEPYREDTPALYHEIEKQLLHDQLART